MSRYASRDTDTNMIILLDDTHAAMVEDEEDIAITALKRSSPSPWWPCWLQSMLDNVCLETSSDLTMRLLQDMILTGFPKSPTTMPDTIRIFIQYRDELSMMDGVVLYQDRIMVPPTLCDSMIEMLHAAHQGVTSMTARARTSVFLPGIMAQIQRLQEQCEACHHFMPNNPKPPPTPSPDLTYLFESV
jgi:hypothetical protein